MCSYVYRHKLKDNYWFKVHAKISVMALIPPPIAS